MAFDISKVPAEDSRGFYYWRTNANPADIASYYGMKKNLETAEQEVDPIQSAINGVTSTAPVSLGVDSLDQAITPLDSSRTTSQLFSDFGAAPQAAEPVAPTSWVSGGPSNLNAEGIDLNKVLATNSYGGALKYSQLPPEDQAVVDARRALSITATETENELFRAENPDFNMGEWYRSQDFNSIDTSNLERQIGRASCRERV